MYIYVYIYIYIYTHNMDSTSKKFFQMLFLMRFRRQRINSGHFHCAYTAMTGSRTEIYGKKEWV